MVTGSKVEKGQENTQIHTNTHKVTFFLKKSRLKIDLVFTKQQSASHFLHTEPHSVQKLVTEHPVHYESGKAVPVLKHHAVETVEQVVGIPNSFSTSEIDRLECSASCSYFKKASSLLIAYSRFL
jgi:hypothetical protein